MFQEQLIPKLTGLLVALAGIAVLVWAFVLKPQIEDTAKTAANKQNAALNKKVDKAVEDKTGAKNTAKAQKAAADAAKAADAAALANQQTNKKIAAAVALEKAKAKKEAAAAAKAAAALGTPGDQRLAAECGPTGPTCAPALTIAKGTQLSVTDIVLQNPQGDAGTLSLLRDKEPLLVQELANFRDLDFHFITPIIFGAGQKLVLSVECKNPQIGTAAARPCTPAVFFTGPTKKLTKKKG